ncbi:MAG: tyrosine--tRNA ligase, partial [Candidatus Methylomirabilis sp.]|nr:tyrosine--tRNA ligase [Deltaproteobacteria bacterium]
MLSVDEQLEIFRRGTTEILSEEELRAKLAEDRPLRIKLGCDPTAPDLHLGHTVALTKLKALQEIGHEIIFIIGDYTAMIGDPSGRNELRPPLAREQVEANAKTYQDQVFKLLDPAKTRVVRNSEWLAPLTMEDALRLASAASLKRMIEKDAFEKRFHDPEASIHLHELMYPLLQGYDSVHLDADVEVGGQDQRFNLLFGRQLQAHFGKPRQVALMLPLLVGTDGAQKMSKSYGNHIALSEDPKTMFDKILS